MGKKGEEDYIKFQWMNPTSKDYSGAISESH